MDELEQSPRPRYLDRFKLKRARLEAGLSQSGLAAKAGTERSSVAHHERGTWGCNMPQLARYAEATGRQPADLMLDSALEGAPAATAA